jgi:hypothetical protein
MPMTPEALAQKRGRGTMIERHGTRCVAALLAPRAA